MSTQRKKQLLADSEMLIGIARDALSRKTGMETALTAAHASSVLLAHAVLEVLFALAEGEAV